MKDSEEVRFFLRKTLSKTFSLEDQAKKKRRKHVDPGSLKTGSSAVLGDQQNDTVGTEPCFLVRIFHSNLGFFLKYFSSVEDTFFLLIELFCSGKLFSTSVH